MQLKPQCNILIRISELEDRLIDVSLKEKKNENTTKIIRVLWAISNTVTCILLELQKEKGERS